MASTPREQAQEWSDAFTDWRRVAAEQAQEIASLRAQLTEAQQQIAKLRKALRFVHAIIDGAWRRDFGPGQPEKRAILDWIEPLLTGGDQG